MRFLYVTPKVQATQIKNSTRKPKIKAIKQQFKESTIEQSTYELRENIFKLYL